MFEEMGETGERLELALRLRNLAQSENVETIKKFLERIDTLEENYG